MSLFDTVTLGVFVDPKLRGRQDILDAQWKSLKTGFTACDNTPDSSFAEFTNDFASWSMFYASESDWSSGSKATTDEWQTKAQDWSNRLQSWGCNGNWDGVNTVSAVGNASSGIPLVKDPPPNDPGIVDQALGLVHKVTDPITGTASTVAWVAVAVLVLAIGAVVYILTKGKASGYGVKVGS
jgi:hypothetical protein